ncbi:DUF3656 domain-containing U32 family peptidase [Methanoplanus endosymbiosus]|uniref:DUF3656 domain-containing protein n=1 Tax=Methanoplanus endosymbiosus TaxID=33865 RepID=A0A9E7PQF9_9EURY|nr:U32 family peptidase [Methanoplanus endosymbiosus]UUX93497.1 DUF3656 domain-containing protein [Methanoplanus endosymbiosus]
MPGRVADFLNCLIYAVTNNRIYGQSNILYHYMKQSSIPELLSPAGSAECLTAAVSAGADAVYLGGVKFGARRYASNFTEDELVSAVRFCHARGVKVYVTHNILVKESELGESLSELLFLSSIGVDAVLIQDVGILKLVKALIPGLTVHASTQMSVHTKEGVKWAEENGVERVVMARETSIDEVSAISASGDIHPGIEIFVHGALCYCYSGQCLISSLTGGRSGNRGICSQPCRRQFSLLCCGEDDNSDMQKCRPLMTRGDYLLSPKDLCLYENIPDIVRSGVKSLKIEGRMKDPSYVAIVTDRYRKAIDDSSRKNTKGSSASVIDHKSAAEDLMFAFNRGFTPGFLSGGNSGDMISYKKSGNAGVEVGTVQGYSRKNKTADIKLYGTLIPQANDGMMAKSGTEEEGFLMRAPFTLTGNSLKVRTPFVPETGSRVFITRRDALEKDAEGIIARDGSIPEKIPCTITLRFKGKIPVCSVSAIISGREFFSEIEGWFEMEMARGRPLTSKELKKIFSKTGGTQFIADEFIIDYPGRLFAPAGLLNELRRKLFSSLDDKIYNYFRPSEDEINSVRKNIEEFLRFTGSDGLTALPAGSSSGGLKPDNLSLMNTFDGGVLSPADDFMDKRSLFCIVSDYWGAMAAFSGGADTVCIEPFIVPGKKNTVQEILGLFNSVAGKKPEECRLIWKWPKITGKKFLDFAVPLIKELSVEGFSGIMAENAGDAFAIREVYPDIQICGGPGLNVFNSFSALSLGRYFNSVIVSSELAGDEIALMEKNLHRMDKRPASGIIVHGAAEISVSGINILSSVQEEESVCGGRYFLKDMKGHKFPVSIDGEKKTHIYNSFDTCLIDYLPEILGSGIDFIVVDSRYRPADYCGKICEIYKAYLNRSRGTSQSEPDDISSGETHRVRHSESLPSLKSRIKKMSPAGITSGHYTKGCE